MASKFSLGFVGAGKMATALAVGFIRAGLVKAAQVIASDPSEASLKAFSQATGARTTAFNPDVLAGAEVIILAVKPDQVQPALTEIDPHFSDKHLLISIAAGVTINKIEADLSEGARIIRVMPNSPALVGASATAFSSSAAATADDCALAQKLFSSVGAAFHVKESLLDAVTGLSGSGPAYVYVMIEALSDGGVAAGLPREIATKLAAQTVLGAARMVQETGLHPGALKDMVTSPGGTTIEGLYALEQGNFRSSVIAAVRAATEKARQLGKL